MIYEEVKGKNDYEIILQEDLDNHIIQMIEEEIIMMKEEKDNIHHIHNLILLNMDIHHIHLNINKVI